VTAVDMTISLTNMVFVANKGLIGREKEDLVLRKQIT
jgi:hypothetical protein